MTDIAYTVVIPAYNAAKFIKETVASVFAQSLPPAHVIVIDDGSTDNTADIVQNLSDKIEVISTANHGQGHATTLGASRVNTALMAFIDADDLWRSNKIECQIGYLLDATLAPDAVLARMAPFGRTDLKTAREDRHPWHRSTLLIWTEAFRRVGPVVDLPNGYGEMIDWFARATEAGLKFHMLDDVLSDRRIHEDSLSFKARPGRDLDYLQAAARALKRKKQNRP